MRWNIPRIIVAAAAAVPLAAAAALGSLWLAPATPVAGIDAGSAAMMRMLRDEHTLIADYVTATTEAQRQANAAADAEVARFRIAAAERQRLHLAQIERAAEAQRKQAAMHMASVAASTAAPQAAHVIAAAPVGEPLPLLQQASTETQAPAKNHEQDHQYGPVRTRLRALASDVRRFPGWIASAADWVSDAMPTLRAPTLPDLPELPRLPGRQFRAML